MSNVAIIPARGGSKRIPRKNIRPFAGKPMIAWSIQAALASGLFGRVIVSTDDSEIAEVARGFGAEVPFVRPPELADDLTSTQVVMRHALAQVRGAPPQATHACCIYATAPFIRAEDLQLGHRRLVESGRTYAFAVTSFEFPIQRALRVDASGDVEPMFPEHIEARSQDLDEAFHDAGQFYWGTVAAFLEGRPLFSRESIAVMLPRHRVQDIDTPEDWRRAELMFQALQCEAQASG